MIFPKHLNIFYLDFIIQKHIIKKKCECERFFVQQEYYKHLFFYEINYFEKEGNIHKKLVVTENNLVAMW